MNLRLTLIVLVAAVSINQGECSWGSFTSGLSHIAKKAASTVNKGIDFARKNPHLVQGALQAGSMLGDEEFLTQMKSLKAQDQDAYDQTIDSLRSDFSSMMNDDLADDIINDLESIIAMDNGNAGIEKELADAELANKFFSSLE